MAKQSNRNWTTDEDRILRREIANHRPIASIARLLGKTETAVYLYAYRHRIALKPTIKNPVMRKLIEIKFGSVEYFSPTRDFFKKVYISQKRWAELVFGYAPATTDEISRVAKTLNYSLDEAFKLLDCRPQSLFPD